MARACRCVYNHHYSSPFGQSIPVWFWLFAIGSLPPILLFVFVSHKAETYANSQVSLERISKPKFVSSNLKELDYDKIKWHEPKAFSKTVSKKYDQFTSEQVCFQWLWCCEWAWMEYVRHCPFSNENWCRTRRRVMRIRSTFPNMSSVSFWSCWLNKGHDMIWYDVMWLVECTERLFSKWLYSELSGLWLHSDIEVYCWRLTVQSIYVYGLLLIFNTDARWFWDHKWMWAQSAKSMPQDMGSDPIFNLKIYYYLQIGYAVHRAYYQLFEHIRKDFWPMMIHHWVAASLLVGSYMTGYTQIGATVLLCNDNCDLLMVCTKGTNWEVHGSYVSMSVEQPLGKLCQYAGWKKMETVFTIAFCILWIPMRIFLYGYKVIWATVVDGYHVVRPYPANWLCVFGLFIIYLLQFFWTKYLLQMVFTKLLKGKGIVDVRSDDEGATGIGKKKQQ